MHEFIIFLMYSAVYASTYTCVNIFSSKTTRPRDMLLILKDTLSIEVDKS